jgi:hypothetical protein
MDIELTRSRLRAILNKVEGWLSNYLCSYCDQREFKQVFDPVEEMKSQLRAFDPNRFGDCPVRSFPAFMPKNYASSDLIGREHVDRLREDIKHALDLIGEPSAVELPAMKLSREGVFFAGQFFDALAKTAEILSSATSKIVLVDCYVDEKVLSLLAGKRAGVRVEILTKEPRPAFVTQAQAFNKQKQYGGLEVRSSNAFHDRFLVIDDADFYHFGASIKDVGSRGFMYSRIEEPDVIAALRKKLSEVWSAATVVI